MTQRDLPIGPPTTIEPPTISETLGTWATGLADHIDTNQFAALKAMAGLTVDPDVLEVNGRAHIIERLDADDI